MGIALVCFLIFLYFLTFFGLKIGRFYFRDLFKKDCLSPLILSVGVLLSNFVLKILYPSVYSNHFLWILMGCVFISILLEQLKPSKINSLMQYALCFVGVSFFYNPFNLSFWVLGQMIGISLFGWMFWRIFIFFDKFPFVSFVLTMAWGLSLLCSGFIMHTLSVTLLFQLLFSSVILMAFNRWYLSQGQLIFGRNLASCVGFLWAALLTYFLSQGKWMIVVSFSSYYLFESFFLLGNLILHYPLKLYLNTVLLMVNDKTRVLKLVFFHILLLMFLSMILTNSFPIYCFVFLIIMADLYLKLEAFIKPSPSWREILKNSKQEVVSVFEQMKKNPHKRQKKIFVKKKVKK